MAATNFTPIQLYRTATASAVPTSGNLADGELAINTNDGKLFYKDSGGVVQLLGTKGGVGSSSTTQLLYNSAGLVVGSASLTFNGTTLTSSFSGPHNGTVGATTPTTGAFTTISATGAISSTVATGTAPFTVASTTQVANLNAATAGTAGNVTGVVAVANGGTGVTTSTGTGNNVLSSLPSFGTTIGVGGATASASGSGISFPATQSASTNANTLDDYEEGTWTPTLNIGGGTTGITYAARSASYVKVGRIVYVSLNIQLSNKGSLSGDVTITGLPFTTNSVADGFAYFGAADYSALSGATAHIFAQALNNSTTIYLCNGSIASAGINIAQETNLLNSSSFNLTGTYITA